MERHRRASQFGAGSKRRVSLGFVVLYIFDEVEVFISRIHF
jgi:hypothetical protein